MGLIVKPQKNTFEASLLFFMQGEDPFTQQMARCAKERNVASSSSEGLCSMMQYSVLYYVSFQEDRDFTSKINTKGAKTTTTRPIINLEALEKNKSADHKVVYSNF